MQTTIKKDIKMEEAEELKAKLEAAGATISIA
jgi:ribosomal protein L7/L12